MTASHSLRMHPRGRPLNTCTSDATCLPRAMRVWVRDLSLHRTDEKTEGSSVQRAKAAQGMRQPRLQTHVKGLGQQGSLYHLNDVVIRGNLGRRQPQKVTGLWGHSPRSGIDGLRHTARALETRQGPLPQLEVAPPCRITHPELHANMGHAAGPLEGDRPSSTTATCRRKVGEQHRHPTCP